ncbi:peroxisome biogenesis factor 10 [Paramarasmius palmivorus]|uniref:RING-type E3 ubiquitin transferase n=1 Tax=Paramarasmius palmivorus TaxID=297713 RepID=A0AAW0BTM8_9AGAR
MSGLPIFPAAQQAQIIRAHQRDLYHVSSLREQTENVFRNWFGTRWLSRWDKEVELFVKLIYYGFTTGRATQTLGEEYTDIWQQTSTTPPSQTTRAALTLLPTLPSYVLSRFVNISYIEEYSPRLASLLKKLPEALQVLTEINLAVFYIRGLYYDIAKRALGVRYISSKPENPHVRPPSYSLLGILIAVRLLYRLIRVLRPEREATLKGKEREKDEGHRETFLDERAVTQLLDIDPESEPAKPAEEDERTILDIPSIPTAIRASRSCTLCLEERTDTCSTECGHLFCWSCIVGWGREKVSFVKQFSLAL